MRKHLITVLEKARKNKLLVLVSVLAIALVVVLIVATGGKTYSAVNYAETMIDLELGYTSGLDTQEMIKLSTESMGYELADYYAFKLRLGSDPTAQREVNEALVSLAPRPRRIADFFYSILDGQQNTPIIDLKTNPVYMNSLLGYILTGDDTYEDFYDISVTALRTKELHNPSADDVVRYLNRYGINPRSSMALSLVRDISQHTIIARPTYYTESAFYYLAELGYELVKPLETPIPIDRYQKLHLHALDKILKEGLTSDEGLQAGLDRYDTTPAELNVQDEWFREYPFIINVVKLNIAMDLYSTQDSYRDSDRLTFHLVNNVLRQIDSSEEEEIDHAIRNACSAYGIERSSLERWHNVALSYNDYLRKIGVVKGLTPENFIFALASVSNQANIAFTATNEQLHEELEVRDISLKEIEDFTSRLIRDDDLRVKVYQAAKELDDYSKSNGVITDLYGAFTAKRMGDAYLASLRDIVEAYSQNVTDDIPRNELTFLAFLSIEEADSLPTYTPGEGLRGFDRRYSTAAEFAVGTIAASRSTQSSRNTHDYELTAIELRSGYYPVLHYDITYKYYDQNERFQRVTRPIALVFGGDEDQNMFIEHVVEVDDYYKRWILTRWSPASHSVKQPKSILDYYVMPNLEDSFRWALDSLERERTQRDAERTKRKEEQLDLETALDEALAEFEALEVAADKHVTVWSGPLNLRERDDIDSPSLGKLEEGETVEFLSEGKWEFRADTFAPWIRVRTRDGRVGYVFSHYTTY